MERLHPRHPIDGASALWALSTATALVFAVAAMLACTGTPPPNNTDTVDASDTEPADSDRIDLGEADTDPDVFDFAANDRLPEHVLLLQATVRLQPDEPIEALLFGRSLGAGDGRLAIGAECRGSTNHLPNCPNYSATYIYDLRQSEPQRAHVDWTTWPAPPREFEFSGDTLLAAVPEDGIIRIFQGDVDGWERAGRFDPAQEAGWLNPPCGDSIFIDGESLLVGCIAPNPLGFGDPDPGGAGDGHIAVFDISGQVPSFDFALEGYDMMWSESAIPWSFGKRARTCGDDIVTRLLYYEDEAWHGLAVLRQVDGEYRMAQVLSSDRPDSQNNRYGEFYACDANTLAVVAAAGDPTATIFHVASADGEYFGSPQREHELRDGNDFQIMERAICTGPRSEVFCGGVDSSPFGY